MPLVYFTSAAAITKGGDSQEHTHVTGTETKPKRYIALIYTDESREANVSPEEQQKIMAAYFQYTEDVRKAGVYVAGDALEGTNMATTVRLRDGKRQTTDGPFAETKEQLGGFYILKCKDLDEALDWAAKIPASEYGSIEVRPLMEFE